MTLTIPLLSLCFSLLSLPLFSVLPFPLVSGSLRDYARWAIVNKLMKERGMRGQTTHDYDLKCTHLS